VFLLEAYTPRQLELRTGGPQLPELMMTAARLIEELNGLTVRQVVELEREIREGQFHHGRGAVVQMIAVKPM
jgi:hypothetical protein